jgi:anti-anti-sigma factor
VTFALRFFPGGKERRFSKRIVVKRPASARRRAFFNVMGCVCANSISALRRRRLGLPSEVTTTTVPHRTKDFMGLHISIRESSDVTIMYLQGRSTISGGESELLSGHLQELVAKGVRKLLLNIGNLSQIDSSGVSVIIGTYVSLKRHGSDLKLLRPGGRVLQVLNVFHLLDIIPSFDDEAQALASFELRSYSASS